MKSAVQFVPWEVQFPKNSASHVKPPGLPVTAGAPVLIPSFLRGSTWDIQFVAASLGDICEPPVDEDPSGSLYVMTCEILVPPEIRDFMVDSKVLLALHSMGTNSNSLCVRLEYAGEGEEP